MSDGALFFALFIFIYSGDNTGDFVDNEVGDLNISVSVLYNYLEANAKVPWEDLRYLFGEIMYGGHITGKCIENRCEYNAVGNIVNG